MDINERQNHLDKQPFYVVSDDAYDRMVLKCEEFGFDKTYTNICSHKDKTKCNCPFNLNVLDKTNRFDFYDKQLMRLNKGIYKPVMKLSTIMNLKNNK